LQLTREQFDDLVRGVEQRFTQQPSALRRRIAGLVALGYAGLLATLLGAMVLAALFFAAMLYADLEGKILLAIVGTGILAAGGLGTLRVLLVHLPAPKGRKITRAEAPALHAWLDELTATLRSAPFHEVLAISSCNASVVQVPRLGVFGWPRNYLLLGLPLMEQLSPEEFRAVLAHEFAHLSREHGRFSRWIYRLRLTWEKIFQEMSRPAQAGISFRPLIIRFVDSFWPRFNAHAFVLSRLNEYEADAIAARTAGAPQLASSLQRLALHNRHLGETVWPEIWRAANTEAEPPAGVFTRLREAMHAGPSPEDHHLWLEEELRLTTTNADTHPCLTDRLQAIGQSRGGLRGASWSTAASSAAESLLGPALKSIRAAVEQQWHKENEANWRERHGRATALNHRLTSIDQAPRASAADADRLWDRVRVLLELHGDEQAGPLLRELLALQPAHPAANFHLGRMLLEKNDPSGEHHLERSMREEAEWVPHACAVLRDYHHRHGRAAMMREVDARLDRYEQQLAASQAERSSVSASDPLIPHGLTAAELAALSETLSAEPDLTLAELARKELKHFPEQKLFLLCVRTRRRWHGLPDTDAEQGLVNRLTKRVRLPGRLLVFAPRGGFGALARKMRKVADVTVHRSS
jgi:Zn-dependent protease with chaperone function